MGKLRVTGYAEREAAYDVMNVVITFRTYSKKVSESIDGVLEQTEKFLKLMKEEGVDTDLFTVESFHSSESYYNNDTYMCTSRELKMRTKLDTGFVNHVMELISEHDFDAVCNIDYVVSNREKIHEELFQEALLDAKKKAEAAVEPLGMKVTGLDEAGINEYAYGDVKMMRMAEADALPASSYQLSDTLRPSYSKESESVTVTWLVENK